MTMTKLNLILASFLCSRLFLCCLQAAQNDDNKNHHVCCIHVKPFRLPKWQHDAIAQDHWKRTFGLVLNEWMQLNYELYELEYFNEILGSTREMKRIKLHLAINVMNKICYSIGTF